MRIRRLCFSCRLESWYIGNTAPNGYTQLICVYGNEVINDLQLYVVYDLVC